MRAKIWKECSCEHLGSTTPSEEAAFSALLHASSQYDPEAAGGLASFGKGDASLPRGKRSTRSVCELLEGDALCDVRGVSGRMPLTGEEFEGVLESGYPSTYHDPVLKHSRKKHFGFS